MGEHGLDLVASKTEAVILTGIRNFSNPSICSGAHPRAKVTGGDSQLQTDIQKLSGGDFYPSVQNGSGS